MAETRAAVKGVAVENLWKTCGKVGDEMLRIWGILGIIEFEGGFSSGYAQVVHQFSTALESARVAERLFRCGGVERKCELLPGA